MATVRLCHCPSVISSSALHRIHYAYSPVHKCHLFRSLLIFAAFALLAFMLCIVLLLCSSANKDFFMRCRVTDNEMMTSFSNPNYGLDALNSNCLLSSPSNSDVIVDNVTSLAGDRRYATDNHLPFEQVITIL